MRFAMLGQLAVCMFVAGCANNSQPYVASFDGTPADPVVREQVTAECTSRAKAAKADVPSTYGPYSTGLEQAFEQKGARDAAFQSCMAEKGMRVTYGPAQGSPAVTTGSLPQQR
jgi:hypothetical protein